MVGGGKWTGRTAPLPECDLLSNWPVGEQIQNGVFYYYNKLFIMLAE